MIPWGMVNLVVVAVWTEYGGRLAGMMVISTERGMAAVGCGVLLLTWMITTAMDPTRIDNRPRREGRRAVGRY
jgi:hypothetical protein